MSYLLQVRIKSSQSVNIDRIYIIIDGVEHEAGAVDMELYNKVPDSSNHYLFTTRGVTHDLGVEPPKEVDSILSPKGRRWDSIEGAKRTEPCPIHNLISIM